MTDAECNGGGTPTTWADTNTANPGCDWNTNSVGDGIYDVIVTFTDKAGNQRVRTRTVTIDNTAPTASFNSFVESTGTQYQATSSH